jgi:two-component system cell cycle response regulator
MKLEGSPLSFPLPFLPAGGDDAGDEGATRPIELACPPLRMRGVLIQTSGLDAGKIHRLEADESTLGRGRACTLQFDDTSLSRVHVRIVRTGEQHVLEDAGSLNGTYVNGQRVTRVVLGHGDRVRLGTAASLRYQLMDDEEERALVATFESSTKDGLTGIFNRRQLEERLAAETAYAVRHGTEVGVALFDLDHFKRVNDTHGHLGGDAVLKAAAAALSATIRREDVLARYGGEELLIIARGVPMEGVAQLAERARAALEALVVPFGKETIRVTASGGVATLGECDEHTVAALLALADARLYQAKTGGRNRVVSR